MTATAGADHRSAPARRRPTISDVVENVATVAESVARLAAAVMAIRALRSARTCPGRPS